MVAPMDRDAIARGQRRRQAEEALEVERDRMTMLEGQIEELVAELLGTRVDDVAFAAMQPEDVETVRSIFDPQSELELEDDESEHEVNGEWLPDEDDAVADEPSPEAEEEDPTAEIEAEISRLEAEIADSRQRQQALERYLEALGPAD